MTVGKLRTPLALTVELFWSYAAAALFVGALGTGDGPTPSLVAIAAAVLGSFALSRALQSTDLDEPTARRIGALASIAAIVLIAHFEYDAGAWLWELGWLGDLISAPGKTLGDHGNVTAGVIAIVAIWLRGIMRGRQPIEFDDVLASASIGIIVMAVAALTSPDARWPGSFGVLTMLYAVLALAALAVYQTPDEDVPLSDFAGRWATTIGGVTGAAACITLVALAVDPDAFGFLTPAGDVLRTVGKYAALVTLAPLFFAIDGVFRFFAWLLGLIFGSSQEFEPQPPEPGPQPETEQDGEQALWETIIRWIFTGGAITVVVALTVIALWFAFRKFARRPARDPRDRRESVEASSTLGDDFAALWDSFRGRFRRRPRPDAGSIEIRRLYAEMLDRAADGGLERGAAVTPMQFAPPLDAHFASHAPTTITEAFAESRYGEHVVDDERVRELRHQWAREPRHGPQP
jgi:hypothetical protein